MKFARLPPAAGKEVPDFLPGILESGATAGVVMPDTRDPSDYVRDLIEKRRKIKFRLREIERVLSGSWLTLAEAIEFGGPGGPQTLFRKKPEIQWQLDDLEDELRIAGWYESTPTVKLAPESAPPKTPRAQQKRKLSKDRKVRQQAIRKGLSGETYVLYLDGHDVKPPQEWVDEGCPKTYPEAYKDPDWQQKIWSEKSDEAKAIKKKQAATRKSQ